jgi:pimeloyl-ACP methyl ester carboxylesterase
MSSSGEARTGFVAINGANLYVETQGQGQPLLLLHAGVTDSRMWDDQFGLFAEHYRVVRCDMRGFGKSKMPPGKFAHYEDMAALMKQLHLDKACIIGLSFGGYVAIDVALAYPLMVAALVLGAPALSGYEATSTELQQFFTAEAAALERGDLATATELNLKMWVDGPARPPEHVSPAIRQKVGEMQLNIFAQPAPADVDEIELIPPALNRLQEIDVPTLVIVGDEDVPEFQVISDLATAGIKNARIVVMPGVAHLPSLEEPNEFNRLVLEFLAER